MVLIRYQISTVIKEEGGRVGGRKFVLAEYREKERGGRESEKQISAKYQSKFQYAAVRQEKVITKLLTSWEMIYSKNKLRE